MSMLKDGAKYEVCFVKRADDSDKDPSSDPLQLAFEAMDSNALEPSWVDEATVLKITRKEPKLFVTDPFEGAAFDHLRSVQCRIVGPLTILTCLKSGDVLPKRPYPVFSVAMRRMTVSCSNVENSPREEIAKKVVLMGGLFSKDLTKSVSHLVVGEVGSKKYQVAANFGLKIMVPEWIEEVWSNGQHRQMHANDPEYDRFKCPVFKGLVITVSQLSAEERSVIQTLVTDNGGTYLAPLKARKTTHLVLNEPSGDKYRYAKTWNVFCVSVLWIYESIKSGYCKDENLFKVDEGSSKKAAEPKRSTPNKDHTSIDLPAIDCSVITNSSVVTHLDETLKSEASFRVPAPRKNSDKASPLDSFDLTTLPKYGQFLDGCKIYLTGFGPAHMDKLRKIVNSGGGIRFSKYTDSITHVVCGEMTPEFRQTLSTAGAVKPFVVRPDWLLECCRKEGLVDENPFLCVDVSPLSPEKVDGEQEDLSLSHISKLPVTQKFNDETPDNVTSIFNQYVMGDDAATANGETVSSVTTDGVRDRKAREALSVDQNDVFNQYASGTLKDASCDDVSDKKGARSSEQNDAFHQYVSGEKALNSGGTERKQSDTVRNVNEDETQDNGGSSEQLFAGLKFEIVGFGEQDTKVLTNMIEAHSGAVLSGDQSDIAVMPITWQPEHLPRAPNVVTNCWLQKCIEECRIFDFDEDELFRPLRTVPGANPFQGFVISVTQYKGTERDCLMYLAEVLGATSQEFFVRKANKERGVLSNTHLVAATPEGSKFEAAKKWKVPAVTKQWVLDATKSGIVPPVEDYLVESSKDHQKENLNNLPLPPTNLPPKRLTEVKQDSPRCLDEGKVKPVTPITNGAIPRISTPRDAGVDSDFVTPRRTVAKKNESRLQDGAISPVLARAEASLNETTGTLNLDQSIKMKFQVSDLLRDLDASSCHETSGAVTSHSSTRLDEMFGRNLASALKKARKGNETFESANDRSSFFENHLHPPETEEEVQVIQPPEDEDGVLKGVVLCVARKLSHLQNELSEIVCSLGGEFFWNYDPACCTHFVFTGKANDLTKEFREARGDGKAIVCPEWVIACKERNERLDEGLYPHTMKSNMTLLGEIAIVKKGDHTPEVVGKVRSSQRLSTPEVKKERLSSKDVPSPLLANNEPVHDFNQQLNDLLAAAKSAKRRQSRRLESVSSTPVAGASDVISPLQHLRQRQALHGSFIQNNDNCSPEEADLESQQSQSCPVVWDDPTGRLEREKIKAAMAAARSPFRPDDENSLGAETSSNSPPLKPEEPEPIKKFMFTNIPDAKKNEYVEVIRALGGEVTEEKSFDPTATHLIMQKTVKNEKFLSSVASGKWVLHPNYLETCRDSGVFLPEDDFEWGGPCTSQFPAQPAGGNKKLASCPHRWRDRLSGNPSSGAFDDWKVVVLADDPAKGASYCKVLEAGGATIVSETDPEISFVMVDAKKKGSSLDVGPFLARGLKCIKPEYIAFYLTDDPLPDIDSYLIPEVKESSMAPSGGKRRNLSIATRVSKRTRYSQAQ